MTSNAPEGRETRDPGGSGSARKSGLGMAAWLVGGCLCLGFVVVVSSLKAKGSGGGAGNKVAGGVPAVPPAASGSGAPTVEPGAGSSEMRKGVGAGGSSGQIPPLVAEMDRAASGPEWLETRPGLYREWAAKDALAAMEHARTRNPGASTMCQAAVLGGWAGRDPEAAWKWLDSQPLNAERSIWLESLLGTVPDDRLESAGGRLDLYLDAPGGGNVVNSFVRRIVSADASRLAAWFDSAFSDGPGRVRAAEIALTGWARTDAEAASGWLAACRPDAPWRDGAIAGLVRSVSSLDPEAARKWVAEVRDGNLRSALEAELSGGTPPPEAVDRK